MRCEQVRELLPEHLLGSLDETNDARVRRHLRGCAECRAELLRLEEGVAALSYATHEAAPPEELREHVLDVLRDEWSEPATSAESAAPASKRAPARRWIAAVAAALLVVSVGWGALQTRRADRVAADASSYQALLATLGGREFRLGELHGMSGTGVSGTVLLYDGDKGWNSWGVVLAHSDSSLTDARAMLVGPGGASRELPPLHFTAGEASSWLVTHDALTGFDELVIVAGDGTVLANARISEA
jgi:hypothetical protein